MTSKISFSKLLKEEGRQLWGLAVLQVLILALLLPFRTLLMMIVWQNDNLRYGGTVYTLAEEFCHQVGLGHMENTFAILVLGMAGALAAFLYVHSAVKQDFYHSLALTRTTLFAVKYLAMALTFAITYAACQAMVLLIGLAYGAMTGQLLGEILLATLQGLLSYLVSFSTTLVAVMMTGNLLTLFCGLGFFACYLPGILLLVDIVRSYFFSTGLYGGDLLTDCFDYTSPWAFALNADYRCKTQGLTGGVPGLGELCQLLALAFVLTALALLLYRKRKTETAGASLVFPFTETAIKVLSVIPVALLAAIIGYSVFGLLAVELLFLLLSGLLAALVIELVYRRDVKGIFRHSLPAGAALLVAVLLYLGLRYDVTGFNTYLPDRIEVSGISFTHYSLSSMKYPDADGNYTGLSGYDSHRTLLSGTALEITDEELLDLLYALAENGVETSQAYGSSDFIYEGDATFISIKFHLTNGKEVFRSYDVDVDVFTDTLDALMLDEGFLEQYFPMFNWTEEYLASICESYCGFYTMGADELFGEATDTATADELFGEATDTATADDTLAEAMATADESVTDTAATATAAEPATADESDTTAETELSDNDYYETYGFDTDMVWISIPTSLLSELREAYLADLKTVRFSELYRSEAELIFYAKSENLISGDYYRITEDFENTLELLKELYYGRIG